MIEMCAEPMASEIDDFSTSQSEMGKAYSDFLKTFLVLLMNHLFITTCVIMV